jgi:hypothetical protein
LPSLFFFFHNNTFASYEKLKEGCTA